MGEVSGAQYPISNIQCLMLNAQVRWVRDVARKEHKPSVCSSVGLCSLRAIRHLGNERVNGEFLQDEYFLALDVGFGYLMPFVRAERTDRPRRHQGNQGKS